MSLSSLPQHIKTAFLNQHSNNQNTLQNMAQVENLMQQNLDFNDFLSALKHWQGTQDFNIQNYRFWLYLLIAVIALICAVLIHPYLILVTFGFGIFAFIKRQSATPYKQLIQRLEQYTLEHKYQLRFDLQDQHFHFTDLSHFPLFSLGDHRNEIENTVFGEWDVQGKSQPFMLFNYHYVDRHESEDSDGKKKVEYKHYDLWGIQVDQMNIQGISISTQQQRACRLGVKWSSSDIQFNQRFQLSGTDEMKLAKFFSPARVLKLDHMLQDYRGDFYIHPQVDSLVWLFKKDILKQESQYDAVQSISDLALHLEHLRMPNYEQLKDQLQPWLVDLRNSF